MEWKNEEAENLCDLEGLGTQTFLKDQDVEPGAVRGFFSLNDALVLYEPKFNRRCLMGWGIPTSGLKPGDGHSLSMQHQVWFTL